MTGFARRARAGAWGELVLELRAVNHRYLDLKLGLPDVLRPLEENLRKCLRERLARGRVDAALRWRPARGRELTVNEALAREVAEAAHRVSQCIGGGVPVAADALRVLSWPGVVETPDAEIETLGPELFSLAGETVEALVAVREREGGQLAAALRERLNRLDATIGALSGELARCSEDIRGRLQTRLGVLGADVDAERVAHEAALLVVRQDASEELDRLAAHASETRRLLEADGAVGRRLDFLMQELAREANTLASKSGDLQVNRLALECKVTIEEMREQVQNVE